MYPNSADFARGPAYEGGMGSLRETLHLRVVQPVKQQLWQGVTPRRLAFSLALGVVVSVMPVLGITTLFALLLSAVLRLNHVAVVAANYAAYPLQIILFIPFFQAGAWITRGPPVPFSLEQVQAELAGGIWATVVRYAEANARAMVAWVLFAPIATWLLYALFHRLLARLPFPRPGMPPAP
jgi:uncharacterized protein (DUF2062 family)